MLRVEADINNLPKYPLTEGYLVTRLSGDKLWFGGFFEDRDRAEEATKEFGNAFILKVGTMLSEPGAKEVYFTADNDKVYKNTPIGNSPDNFMTKTEIMFTKEVFLECLRKWGR